MFYALIFFFVLGAILFYTEVKNAPLIDDKEPFLHDDYDPAKDPTISHNT